MRYVIVGAGGIGGTIAGFLALAGSDVAVVARGADGEAIRANGLLVRHPEGEARVELPCVDTPAEVDWRADDVVVLATKVHQATVALDDVAASAPASVVIACATNGLEGERLALRRFAAVQGILVNLPAEHLDPGVVSAFSWPPGVLDVGRYPAGADDVSTTIAADLTAAGFASRTDSDIMRRKRQKLLMNLSNVLDAAVRPGDDVGDVWRAARAEAEACYRAAGLAWATDEEDRIRREESGLGLRSINGERRAGGSTHQSLARGKGDTEADFLNGEVVLLGRVHGVPTPVNEALQRLARELAATRTPPDSLSADELRARL